MEDKKASSFNCATIVPNLRNTVQYHLSTMCHHLYVFTSRCSSCLEAWCCERLPLHRISASSVHASCRSPPLPLPLPHPHLLFMRPSTRDINLKVQQLHKGNNLYNRRANPTTRLYPLYSFVSISVSSQHKSYYILYVCACASLCVCVRACVHSCCIHWILTICICKERVSA